MEGNQPQIRKYAIQWGVISAVIGIVFQVMLMFQKMHYEQSTAIQVIGISILFAVIAFGINSFKKDNGGFLKLNQALKLGTAIAVVSGLVGLIYYFLLSNDILEAGYMEKTMELAKNKAFADNPNMTQEQWDQGMEMQEKFQYLAYPFILIFNAILGLVAGLIFGLIMKKDSPTY
jgi:hypothetical protein